jgi:hypothetical protein
MTASGSQEPSGPRRALADAGQSSPPRAPNAALLEKVLRETEELLCGDGPLSNAEKAAMQEVARRHRGQPLSLGPVAVQLVQAVLGTRFESRADSEGLWREMATAVAESILGDPVARARLRALWKCLTEGGP